MVRPYALSSPRLDHERREPLNALNPPSTYIALDANDSILLVGVHCIQLTPSNFVSF